MAVLYTPSEKGFDQRLEAIDRCQVALLRELSGQLGSRLILKGGMAMRAAFGSMRLTKDIDFDRDPTLAQDTLKKNIERVMIRSAGAARILRPEVKVTKDTKTTVRIRLSGLLPDQMDVRFDVEVSGRDIPSAENVRSEIVAPPGRYAMSPFPVTTYTNAALAVMKVGAALSEQRNAPRDLYDLRDLIWSGVNPIDILARQDPSVLEAFAERSLGKLEMLTFQLAEQELLPYLPVAERSALNESTWLDATLLVADAIHGWCHDALRQQRQMQERQR